MPEAVILLALALLVAGSSLLVVDVPRGGHVPLGHAVVVALIALLTAPELAIAVGGGLVLATVVARARPSLRALAPSPWVAVAAAAGAGAAEAVRSIRFDGRVSEATMTVVEVTAAGVVFFAVDALVRAVRRRGPGDDVELRHIAPVHLSLLCAAALLAVTAERSVGLALLASIPLLVTRYSFRRYTDARRTYSQTVEALGLLPEVAGLTALGHGHRTAIYAEAAAYELDLDDAAVRRVVTAARLHHIGHVSVDELPDPTSIEESVKVARVSGEILRETGFLTDVAPIVESAQVDGWPGGGIEAALVRLASDLDEALEAGEADATANLVRRHPTGAEHDVALALDHALRQRPELVEVARAATAHLLVATHSDD
jgi:hypothetical protein